MTPVEEFTLILGKARVRLAREAREADQHTSKAA